MGMGVDTICELVIIACKEHMSFYPIVTLICFHNTSILYLVTVTIIIILLFVEDNQKLV